MKTQALAQIPETKRADGAVDRLSDVVKVYKAGDVVVSAIKGITFDIPRPRFPMIAGPSGSWKTTLLNLISCINKPTQGTTCTDRCVISGLTRFGRLKGTEIGRAHV